MQWSGPVDRGLPPARWSHVPPVETQAQLRLAFGRWGRPERLRVDNGVPWGTQRGDLPTDLGLWLAGLGWGVDFNPPATPQDNGVVERSQGTAKRWGEPQTCDSPEELRERLGVMDVIQRAEYPSVRGLSRLEAYPGLAHSGRVYTPEWEQEHWRLEAVARHLSLYSVPRRVGASGSISIYNWNVYIGKIYKGKILHLMFDPLAYEWVVSDDEGRQISRQARPTVNRERVLSMTVTNRG